MSIITWATEGSSHISFYGALNGVSAGPGRAVLTMSATHREPAPDVSDEEECVVFEVAHHGVAAAQLRGAAVSLVVVADGAVADHSQNKREDPLGRGGREGGVSLNRLFVIYSSRKTIFPQLLGLDAKPNNTRRLVS